MQTLNKFTASLTQRAFARYGFHYGELLTQWPEIIGEDLARISQPEKMKWPYAQQPAKGKPLSGTLILRVEPGHSVDIQYCTPMIIERVNQFYGHQAVQSVKLQQGTIPSRLRPRQRKALADNDPRLEGIASKVSNIEDENLRAALARLGRGIVSTN